MALAELLAKIKISGVKESTQELGGLKSQLSSLGPVMGSVGNVVGVMENALKSAWDTTVKTSLALGALGVVASVTQANFDSLTRGLATFSKGPEDLTNQLARLREVARLPGLGMEEAIQGSISLQAAGLSAALAERSLTAFGNALTTVGKGKAELDGVTLALSQIASKGKLTGEELNQLAERTPQVRQALLSAFGTADTEAIQKMGIDATTSISMIVAELEKLPRASGGIKNTFENFADSVKTALLPLGQGINEAFMSLAPTLDGVIVRLGEVGRSIGEVVSAIGRSGVVESVFGQLSGALQNLTGQTSFREIFIEFIAGIASVIGTLPSFVSAVWQNIRATFENGMAFLKGFAASVSTLVGGFLSAFEQVVSNPFSPTALGGAVRALKDAADQYKIDGISAVMANIPQTAFTDVPNLFGNQKAFADSIRGKLQPLAPLPNDLNFGGGASVQAQAMDNTFAAWDKYLAGIEKNTAKTADALTARVVGGGPLAKMGLTGAERYRAPDPITRSVASGLEREINRVVDRRARSARAQSNLLAVR